MSAKPIIVIHENRLSLSDCNSLKGLSYSKLDKICIVTGDEETIAEACKEFTPLASER